jgi:hypothetical protein
MLESIQKALASVLTRCSKKPAALIAGAAVLPSTLALAFSFSTGDQYWWTPSKNIDGYYYYNQYPPKLGAGDTKVVVLGINSPPTSPRSGMDLYTTVLAPGTYTLPSGGTAKVKSTDYAHFDFGFDPRWAQTLSEVMTEWTGSVTLENGATIYQSTLSESWKTKLILQTQAVLECSTGNSYGAFNYGPAPQPGYPNSPNYISSIVANCPGGRGVIVGSYGWFASGF